MSVEKMYEESMVKPDVSAETHNVAIRKLYPRFCIVFVLCINLSIGICK